MVAHFLDHHLDIEAAFGDRGKQHIQDKAPEPAILSHTQSALRLRAAAHRHRMARTTSSGATPGEHGHTGQPHTFNGAIAPTYSITSTYCCSWASKPVVRLFSASSAVPPAVIRGLGAEEDTSYKHAVQQLLFITQLPPEVLKRGCQFSGRCLVWG